MTLLHTVLSSRAAARSSIEIPVWPARTVLTADDVLVDGVSLSDLARTSETPVVCSPGRPTVVVVRVDAVIPPLHGHPRAVWVDAELDGCAPVLSAVRLLARHGSAHSRRYQLRPDRSNNLVVPVRLPDDVRRGDLLAIPCLASVLLEDIQR